MGSIDLLTDHIFACSENPVWVPREYNMENIPFCNSCILRLNTPVAGPGTVSPRDAGLTVEESPLATFSVNGIQHNLIECVLNIPGAHRLSGQQNVAEAELNAYFRQIDNNSIIVCLCIPIITGAGETNRYFSTLDRGIVRNRSSLSTLLNANTNLFFYRGPDLRGRNANAAGSRALCEPIRQPVTFYVSETPAKITAEDLRRLTGRSGSGRVGPPRPITEAASNRFQKLATRVKGIRLPSIASSVAAHTPTITSGISTNALKCYKIDPSRDIVNNKIYVGGKSDTLNSESTSLDKTLENAAININADLEDAATIQPGDIQKGIAIALGVLAGILICAGIAYYVLKHVYRNYVENVRLYDTPFPTPELK